VPRREVLRGLALVCAFGIAVSTTYTNHGPVLGLIIREFALSSADGGAVATAFFVGVASSILFGGLLADRIGARPVVTGGFLVAVLGTLATGLFTPTFAVLLAWRIATGVGAGLAFAAGAAYTRSIFSGRGAHLAQGLYGASFLAGSGSTLLFMPLLAGPAGDWRGAYFGAGLGVGAVWLAWVLLAPRGPDRFDRGAGLGAALRDRNAWLLALCHMCGFGLAMVVSTWVTSYFVRGYGLGLAQSGALGSLLLVTGIAARSIGGGLIERGVPAIGLIRTALGIAAGGLLVMALPGGLPIALGGLLLTGLGIGLPYAAVFNGAAASVPRSPASAQAFVGWGGTLVAVFGPPVVGALLDRTGSFAAGFGALAAFALLVLLGTAILRPFSLAAAPEPAEL
jgi:nitrate/nitrite transporter NarK